MIQSAPAVEHSLFTAAWEWSEPGTPQHRFLHCWRPEVALLGGRGTRKTAHLVAADAISAMLVHRGGVGYLTEQTNTQVEDILLPFYREFVNPDLYHISGGQGARDVNWTTGAVTRLRSRQATSKHKDPPFRGPSSPRGIGHDEIAIDEDPVGETRDPILISMAMLRGGGETLGCAVKPLRYTTTPKRNFFFRYMDGLGLAENGRAIQESKDGRSKAFYARTRDMDPDLYARLLSRYSADFASQELDAMWMEAVGRVWTTFLFNGLDNDLPGWPDSNIHTAAHGYDPSKPWVLGVDLGAGQSAWNLAQPYPAVDQFGKRVFHGNVLVTIAEWTPSRVSNHLIIDEIKNYTNGQPPHRIWIGHDYNTPGGASGTTPALAFSQAGWGNAVRTHAGAYTFAKDAQAQAAFAAICNAVGERRYAVSKHLESFHEDGRGVLDMLRRDEWPTKGTSYFEKSKTLGKVNDEDARDAMLYMLAGEFPPPFQHTTKPPAVN